jgi:putative endonuclease
MDDVAWVYIFTNRHHTTLYVGATTKIGSRAAEHKFKHFAKAFTAKYNVNKMVYFLGFKTTEEAFRQEKYIKGKNRKWKIDLIESVNPSWRDLFGEIPI